MYDMLCRRCRIRRHEEYAEYAEYAENAEYAEYAKYAEYANYAEYLPIVFLVDQKSKISESESSINSRTCLGHLVLLMYFLDL